MTDPIQARDRDASGLGPTEQFWSALELGQLMYQRCADCGRAFHRPRLVCPICGSSKWEWRESRGRGSVYSVTTVERSAPAFRDEAPFQVALVDMEEGFRAFGRVVGAAVAIGDSVEFELHKDHEGRAAISYRRLAV